jgi:hypothetical protein
VASVGNDLKEGLKQGSTQDLEALFVARRDHPVLLEVPPIEYLMIDGRGAPGPRTQFQEAIEALYGVAYAIKFDLRAMQILDYKVLPLEALWWREDGRPLSLEDRSAWRWRAMLAQPAHVTQEVAREAVAKMWKRHGWTALWELRLETFHEGWCAQVLHVGPYDAEGPTLEGLMAFIRDEGYEPWGKHHEIYLGDPRRSAPERLRTIIRHPVSMA